MNTFRAKVCVLGAGGGGTGCVYRLLKNGIDTVVIDKNPDFGGTAVFSGVDGFEPGVSLDGIHQEISRILTEKKQGFVVKRLPNGRLLPEADRTPGKDQFPEYPWVLADKTEEPYSATLSRKWGKRFQFDPDAFTAAVREILSPCKEHLTELFGWEYDGCRTENGNVTAITLRRGEERAAVEAEYFVDASGDIVLARDAGCAYTSGTEAREVYGEPGAPLEASDTVNAVTYCFRITRAEDPEHIDPEPGEHDEAWENTLMRGVVSCFSEYPDGDINVNMLPTMQGREYMELGEDADRVGHMRVKGYWHYLQTEKKLRGWTIRKIYSAGVRETYRLKGRHILTEQEVRAGRSALDSVAAIADHALDIHGESGMLKELEKPYIIPLECTMTREYENLFVACRGASFSHIAGASARLIRTMLSLGESVGEHIAGLLK